MKATLETIAEVMGMDSHYGEGAYNNLKEFDQRNLKKKMIISPISYRSNFTSGSGMFKNETITGDFFIASDSSLDEFYDGDGDNVKDKGKYELYLKPNKEDADTVRTKLMCYNEFEIRSWTSKEVINLFDSGCDGCLVTFSIDTV